MNKSATLAVGAEPLAPLLWIVKSIAAIATALAVSVPPADAFTYQDAKQLYVLSGKITDAMSDIGDTMISLDSSNDAHEIECLSYLHDALNDIGSYIYQLFDLLLASAQVVNQKDEGLINNFIGDYLTLTLQNSLKTRAEVNRTADVCRRFAVVATKAQSVLDLLTEIDILLRLARPT